MAGSSLMDPLLYYYKGTILLSNSKVNYSNLYFNLFIAIGIFLIAICIIVWKKKKGNKIQQTKTSSPKEKAVWRTRRRLRPKIF